MRTCGAAWPRRRGRWSKERKAHGGWRSAGDFRDRTDRAIVALFGGNLLEVGQWLYRMDRFLMLLAADPRRAHEFSTAWSTSTWSTWSAFWRRFGPYIEIIVFGDDLGMQNGPQISRGMYQEFFKPRHAKMWRRAKELAKVKVMLHCCGGVRPLLPDLIEAGLDAINPVQISCTGMEAHGLKTDFGDHITFWGGGCDTRFVLSQASPDEVREHVRQQVAISHRRRVRLSAGPQRAGRRAAGERDCHVRCGERAAAPMMHPLNAMMPAAKE